MGFELIDLSERVRGAWHADVCRGREGWLIDGT